VTISLRICQPPSTIKREVVVDLIETYDELVTAFRKGDVGTTLKLGGKFVEHTLRALEFIRTKVAPTEIKSVTATVKLIFDDKTLPESIRILLPRVAQAMVYEIRSKRDGVHVNEIDPTNIDVMLCVNAAS
jgi:hypothetical protein